jgi:hypothetical protein
MPSYTVPRWRAAMKAAGLPAWTAPRAIGRRQLEERAHLKDADPETWAVLKDGFRECTRQFNERLPASHRPLDAEADIREIEAGPLGDGGG